MAEIVNLRRARKAKARTEKESEAAANRTKFGEAKPARATRKANADLEARKLAAHKRDDATD